MKNPLSMQFRNGCFRKKAKYLFIIIGYSQKSHYQTEQLTKFILVPNTNLNSAN